jgi:hypothetical protein
MTNVNSMKKTLWERVEESGIVRAEVVIRRSQSRRDPIWILTILECPFCGKSHEHGGGVVGLPPLLGSRVAHCFRPTSPGEYELFVKEDPQRED